MCFSLRWRLFCVLGGIISRAEYSKSPSVSRETIPPRRLAEEGVKNWSGRRNRLPHPVCKPLDSKEGGAADGFGCRAAPGLLTYDFWERASFPLVIHYGQYKQYVLPNFELRSQM